jgi:endoglucanase
MGNHRWIALLGAVAIVTATSVAAAAVATAGTRARVRTALSSGCADPYSSQRDPSNPLMLGTAPGSNPLSGASFFVDGPTHGAAAGEIARLLGIDSTVPMGGYLSAFPDNESWAQFERTTVAQRLSQYPSQARNVGLLEKIASQPEAQRVSSAVEGGTASGIADFMRKLFCHNFTADPGTVPIIATDFLHQSLGGCPSAGQIRSYMPLFQDRINAVVAGTGNRPAVYLLELDAIGSSSCILKSKSAGGAWESALKYEVDQFAKLPHAVVYVEAGYSDGNSPSYTAKALNRVDIRKIRGFFTNDTHNEWTSNEVKWGEKISKMTHGAHFIVDTAQNGQGPKLNPHPSKQGVEDLCNPLGRGLGPPTTTATGFPDVDAYMWTHIPGNSTGTCNGGPSGGLFFPAYAEGLASRANGKLGPGYPSKPY